MNNNQHIPVLAKEAINYLDVQPKNWYIDATFGRGGHTNLLLEKKAKVIALDFDQQAIEFAKQNFKKQIDNNNLLIFHQNFSKLEQVYQEFKTQNTNEPIKGILFDLGTSTQQLKSKKRGFSFQADDEKLDMRMDQRLNVKAADLLMIATHGQLTKIFEQYGGETYGSKIAKSIINQRKQGNFEKISTVKGLVSIINKVKPQKKYSKIHPATKVFQALRIAVNDELNNLKKGLTQALTILSKPARLVVISFHQGEDRIVKNYFKQWSEQKLGTVITKKPIQPTKQEINRNNRARSAKMRVFEK